MPSHQEIAGVSDQEMLERMLSSHADRFDDLFWSYISEQVTPRYSAQTGEEIIVDIGCGPGLLLRDFSQRFPNAELHGYDLTPAMIDHARSQMTGDRFHFDVLDVTTDPVPLDDHSVSLLLMTAVLHVLDEPLAMCDEIKRLLKPNGLFLLSDWVRQPLSQYLEMMMANVPKERAEVVEKAMLRLSVAHNKYSIEDWLWLLDKAGFNVLNHAQIRSEHFCAFVCEAKPA